MTVKGARITTIDYVDYGVYGEYGFFGKIVARSDVRGMTEAERDAEIARMKEIVGEHVVAREVEEV